MDPVNILTFNEPDEAAPVIQRLEQSGIKAEIQDQRNLQKYWFISEPLAGVRVRVDKKDYQRAKELVQEWDGKEACLDHAIHCPECGSSEIEYPQFTRKFVLPTFYALLCKIGLFETEFYCQHCHYTWPTKIKLEGPKDVLGWPNKRKSATSATRS
ncbi:MAG TPA: DUF2007 domain-containing protein [Verrucomicrobiae bacterium]